MIGHGDKLLDRAEAEGYIYREESESESGTGFHPVYNLLTPKGKQLLSKLKKV
jgi:DNA-binding MarR family transcriptional regulator